MLELGSGGGFLERSLPLITSEVFYCRHVKAILNGQALPFASGSLRAIVMTDVLHHIPGPAAFFQEAGPLHPSGRSDLPDRTMGDTLVHHRFTLACIMNPSIQP